LTDIKVLF